MESLKNKTLQKIWRHVNFAMEIICVKNEYIPLKKKKTFMKAIFFY